MRTSTSWAVSSGSSTAVGAIDGADEPVGSSVGVLAIVGSDVGTDVTGASLVAESAGGEEHAPAAMASASNATRVIGRMDMIERVRARRDECMTRGR